MISPLTNERKFGDVSTEDFTTLGVAVVQNSSDITTANTQIAANAAKPSSSQVDSQIDAKNTTQMTQLYTRAQVDTAVAGRTTPADVQLTLNTRFQAQDASNFIVFQDRATSLSTSTGYTRSQVDAAVTAVASTAATDTAAVASTAAANASSIAAAAASTYTKTQVDAALSSQAATNVSTYATQATTYTKTESDSQAATYATQTALGAVSAAAATNATNLTATQVEVVLLQNAVTQDSATLAGVVAGTQALSAVDVQGNLTTTGTANIGSALQCVDLTATGRILSSSWGAFGSIPPSPAVGDLSCLNFSSTSVNCNALTVNGQSITGAGASPSVGDVLKSTRICMSPHAYIGVPTNGNSIVVSSLAYVPSSAQSTIHITFVGTRLMAGAAGTHGQWITTIMTGGGTHLGHSMHGYNDTLQIVDSSPTYASYTNSSTNSIAFAATIKQLGGSAGMAFFQSSGVKTCWFHIEEVQR